MNSKQSFKVSKNARETIYVQLGEFKGHRYIDMRIFVKKDDEEPIPTKKGLAVSPSLWPHFRAALARAEAAMIEAGWLDREDLNAESIAGI